MGTVIGVFSAKGGVGKTLLATNLLVAFGVGHRKKTILIDLNSGIGTADLLLDLKPERSWSDLVSVINELTPKHIRLAITEYRPGVDLLACSQELVWKGSLSKKNLSALLNQIRHEYDLVLLDTPTGSGGVIGAALSLSDIRLITLTPDAPCLRGTARFLNALPDQEKVTGLIINQQAPGAAVKPDEIKSHLGQPLMGVFPIDPASVWANISYGEPSVLRKNSKFGKTVRQLTNRLLKMIDQMEL